MIKKIVNVGAIFIIVAGILLGIKMVGKENHQLSMYMAIGDSLLVQQPSYGKEIYEVLEREKGVTSYSDIVKRTSLDTSSLLRFIEVKATIVNGENNENIHKLIEKSKYITLQVGEVDLNSNVRFNKIEEKFYYNVEVIERIISNVQENIYNIVNEISQINNEAKVYVLGYYFPYPSINENQKAVGLELYGQLNSAIRLGSYDAGATYVDISDLSCTTFLPSKETSILNEIGQKKLVNTILDVII